MRQAGIIMASETKESFQQQILQAIERDTFKADCIRHQIDACSAMMACNIEKVLERGEKIETLVDRSCLLEDSRSFFAKRQRKSFLSRVGSLFSRETQTQSTEDSVLLAIRSEELPDSRSV